MFSFKDQLPKIETISQTEKDILEIQHSKGRFKISKHEIVNVALKSDNHSAKSAKWYSEFGFWKSVKSGPLYSKFGFWQYGNWGLMWIIFIALTRNVSALLWLFFGLPEYLHFWVFLITFSLLYWPFKYFIFPLFYQVFYYECNIKDILVIDTVGNKFIFRTEAYGTLYESALTNFNITHDPNEKHSTGDDYLQNIFYFILLYLLPTLCVLIITRFSIFEYSHNYFTDLFIELLYATPVFDVIILPCLFIIVLAGIVMGGLWLIYFLIFCFKWIINLVYFLGIFPVFLLLKRIVVVDKPILIVDKPILIVFLDIEEDYLDKIIIKNLGILFLVFLFMIAATGEKFTGTSYLLGLFPGILCVSFLRFEEEILSTIPLKKKIMKYSLLFCFGLIYFIILKGIIYDPIRDWTFSIHPFWYGYFFDYIIYIYIISMVTTYTYYFILLIFNKMNKNSIQEEL